LVRWPRNRQALAVPQASERAEVHLPLDVHGDVAAQVAFDTQVASRYSRIFFNVRLGELLGLSCFLECRFPGRSSLAFAGPTPNR